MLNLTECVDIKEDRQFQVDVLGIDEVPCNSEVKDDDVWYHQETQL